MARLWQKDGALGCGYFVAVAQGRAVMSGIVVVRKCQAGTNRTYIYLCCSIVILRDFNVVDNHGSFKIESFVGYKDSAARA